VTDSDDRHWLRSAQRRAEELAIAQSERRARNETEPTDRLKHLPGSPAGDEERLRKIPVSAPGGWGGVIPGTHPEREAIRRAATSDRRGNVDTSRRGP
jgi:hypothetical protein